MRIFEVIISVALIITFYVCMYLFTMQSIELNKAMHKPTRDWLELTDNLSTYHIHSSATAHISEIYEDSRLRYEIEITDDRGSFTIVYTDQVIEGQFISAKMWLDSFELAMEEFKNGNN